MKAILAAKYGGPDVLMIQEVEKPSPKDNEVLIRIESTVAAFPDCAFREGKPFISRLFTGLIKPKQIPGDVFAGVIEWAGKAVSQFKAGDEVYGSSGSSFGTNAEYIALSEDEAIVAKPRNIPYEEAAAISEGALTALPFLRDSGKIKKGQKVLINGASGGVGVSAVQLAKYFGADVTAVCGPKNIELVKSLGADKVIDYTREDFTKSGDCYDIIFDAVAKSSFSRCKKALSDEGIYLTTIPSAGIMISALLTSFSKRKAVFAATGLRKPSEKREDLHLLSTIIEAGKLKAVIGRTYPLEQMADAHRYVETGHKTGNAVIAVNHAV
ncbi:MAG: NAD(P)-dependent alcohol dehydrogenase [Christensenellales bacterium]